MSLRILQTNQAHCRAASAHLEQAILELTPHIILIQEPYLINNMLVTTAPGFSSLGADHHAKVAILYKQTTYDVFPIHIGECFIIIKLQNHTTTLIIINVYSPPNCRTSLSAIQPFIKKLKSCQILMAGDFNARHSLWGDRLTDQKGEDLVDFILINDFDIINPDDSPPTFESTRGKTSIDLTLSSHNLTEFVSNWEVKSEENGSDHRFIAYNLYGPSGGYSKRLTRRGRQRLYQIIGTDSWYGSLLSRFHSGNISPDKTIHTLQKRLKRQKEDCKSSTLNHHRMVPWWNDNLHHLRKESNSLRRQVQKQRKINGNAPQRLEQEF